MYPPNYPLLLRIAGKPELADVFKLLDHGLCLVSIRATAESAHRPLHCDRNRIRVACLVSHCGEAEVSPQLRSITWRPAFAAGI